MMESDDARQGSSSAAANTNNSQQQESVVDKMVQSVKNCCQATGLCCFKFKEQSQISGLQFKITQRQKKFGIDYLTLVEDKAPQEQLKKCLKEALADIAEVQKDINRHHDAIDNKTEEVNEKIQGGSSNTPKKQKKQEEESKEEEEAPAVGEDTNEEAPKKTKKKKKKKPAAEPTDENFSIDEE